MPPPNQPPPPSASAADPGTLRSYAVLLRRMTGEFNRLIHAFAHDQGLHPTDVQALISILDEGPENGGEPMTPGRLRARLNLTSGAMTACLDRLERAGHIRRTRDAQDRRVVHLHYAAEGKRVAREFFQPLATVTATAMTPFSDAERRAIGGFLSSLNEELAGIRDQRP
ncbi:MarR family winged helix-turn-helix transcriptional regulator [Streptomyces xiamenensis]|uniref:MarR family winged helix-turn-helix transcriptional regulator n=1 Tax=Streptomyces xiamenensis TaxID=408015 RepID=UPI003D73AF4F